jgi:hypothetical protein
MRSKRIMAPKRIMRAQKQKPPPMYTAMSGGVQSIMQKPMRAAKSQMRLPKPTGEQQTYETPSKFANGITTFANPAPPKVDGIKPLFTHNKPLERSVTDMSEQQRPVPRNPSGGILKTIRGM